MPARSSSDRAAPAVSIGLPVHNGERFLAGAIESLLGQSAGDLELIVSDNASTDGTREVCERFAREDRRVRYFRQDRNIGAPGNWNFVVHRARGRYFKWAAANDWCARDMVARCAEVLDRDPGAVLCYGRTALVDDADGEERLYERDLALADERPSERFARVCRELELNNAQCALVRLDVLRRTGLDRPYPAGDLVLMAELALAGRWRLLPDVLLYRRMGRQTFSRFLSSEQLRAFFDPGARAAAGLDHWRRHLDYFATIARTPIATREKLRTLALAARHAYWDQAALLGEARTFLFGRPA